MAIPINGSINEGSCDNLTRSPGRARGNSDPGVSTPLLGQSKRRLRSGSIDEDEAAPRPALLASRIGLISSEYTAASKDPRGILFEHTRPVVKSRSVGSGLGSTTPGV
jgi:hypothetical protein